MRNIDNNKTSNRNEGIPLNVDRRRVLKAIGAGGTAIGAFSGQVTSSEQYDVWVWITEEQYLDSSYKAQDAVIEYLEGAFSNTDGVSVFALTPNDLVPAPVENSYQEDGRTFIADDPCDNTQTEYQTLAHWWLDYLNCQTNHAADSNLLITNSTERGGYAFYDDADGIAAVTEGGPHLEDDSTYDQFENSYDSRAHRTALEEIGHNLQMTDSQAFTSTNHKIYDQHKTGTTTQTSGFDAHMVTPLGRLLCEDSDDANTCGNFAETDVNCGDYGDWMKYSDCSVHYWNSPE